MSKQWKAEIPLRECLDDVRQVQAERFLASSIFWICGFPLDGLTVRIEAKMVGRLVLRKAHRVFTTFFHFPIVLIGLRLPGVLFMHWTGCLLHLSRVLLLRLLREDSWHRK